MFLTTPTLSWVTPHFSCYGNRQNEYNFATSEEDKSPYRLFDGVLNEDIVEIAAEMLVQMLRILQIGKFLSYGKDGTLPASLMERQALREQKPFPRMIQSCLGLRFLVLHIP